MSVRVASIRGWEIHQREDGSFGVYNGQGLIAGPFRTQQAAINAANLLPVPRPIPEFTAAAR